MTPSDFSDPHALSAPGGPSLGAADLRRVFPFLVQLDRRRCVRAVGPALQAACPALRLGLRLGALFGVRGADGMLTLDEGLAAAPHRLTLVSTGGAALQLSGPVLAQGDDLLLLLLGLDTDSSAAALPGGTATATGTDDDLAGGASAQAWRQRASALERILELAPEGVMHFDPLGRLRHCNARLERILEMPRDELLGQSLAEIDGVLQSCLLARHRQPVLGPLLARLSLAAEPAPALLDLALPLRKTVAIAVRGEPQGDVIFYLNEVPALQRPGSASPTGFGGLATTFDDNLEPLPLPQVQILS
jgi:PAS domain-containing protein